MYIARTTSQTRLRGKGEGGQQLLCGAPRTEPCKKPRLLGRRLYVTDDDDDDDDVERDGCFCVFSQYSGAKRKYYNSGQYMAANAHLPIIAFADRTSNTPVYLKRRHRATFKKRHRATSLRTKCIKICC